MDAIWDILEMCACLVNKENDITHLELKIKTSLKNKSDSTD